MTVNMFISFIIYHTLHVMYHMKYFYSFLFKRHLLKFHKNFLVEILKTKSSTVKRCKIITTSIFQNFKSS